MECEGRGPPHVAHDHYLQMPFYGLQEGDWLAQSPPWSFLFLLWPPSGLPSTQQPEGLLHSCESDSLPNPLQSPRVAPTSLRGKANILSTPYKPLPDLAPSLTSFCELALSIILKTPGLECSKLSTRGFPCTAAPTCILISLSCASRHMHLQLFE